MRSPFRKHSKRMATEAAKTGTLAKLGALITVVGAVLGGLWVLFQFAYSKWIEPRLSAAVVQASTAVEFISETECCRYFEITTRLENKGHRDITIHASHQAVGARRLVSPKDAAPDTIEQSNQAFLLSRVPGEEAAYIKSPEVEYVATRLEVPFLILSVGNLVIPGSQLAPGELHTSRSIAAVPKDHMALSVRGSLLVSHFTRSDLDWYWTLQPKTLQPLVLPWRRAHSATLSRLTNCVRQGETEAEKRQCVSLILNEANKTFREAWEADSNTYSQHYTADFVAAARLSASSK